MVQCQENCHTLDRRSCIVASDFQWFSWSTCFSCSALPATDVPGQPDEQHAKCNCSQHQLSPGLLLQQPLWHQHPRCQLHPRDPGHHRRRGGSCRRDWQRHIRYNFTRLSHVSLDLSRLVFCGLFVWTTCWILPRGKLVYMSSLMA